MTHHVHVKKEQKRENINGLKNNKCGTVEEPSRIHIKIFGEEEKNLQRKFGMGT
jgi:hypothetical protein